ncbi:MAG: hypothetical protein HC795_11940 [Coleofasciculaceae cyanobacterium RL_1_1]|nr:hypothetical protein [Coleofasciculaceae cyanobacterium RL_1_1]
MAQQARNAYNSGDYERAATLLETLITELDNTHPNASIERAIAIAI